MAPLDGKYTIVLLHGKAHAGKDTTAAIIADYEAQAGRLIQTFAFADALKNLTLRVLAMFFAAQLTRAELDEIKNANGTIRPLLRPSVAVLPCALMVAQYAVLTACDVPPLVALGCAILTVATPLCVVLGSLAINARSLLQDLGTTLRTHLYTDIFAHTALMRTRDAGDVLVVFTDCRYDNEVEYIANNSPDARILFVHLTRSEKPSTTLDAKQAAHSSEKPINFGSLTLPHGNVDHVSIANDGTLADLSRAVRLVLEQVN
jgi:hypothetical protein